MLSRAAIALLPLLVIAQERGLSGGYNYNRCDDEFGPEYWPDDCRAQETGTKTGGTPIDLCGAVDFPADAPTITTSGYDTGIPLTISSDGSSIKVTVSDDDKRPSLTAGLLSKIVGRSDEDEEFEWHLEQMHLHWGRNEDEGSEHYLQGERFAAEAHFVHYNSKYGNFSNAVTQGVAGMDDALLVVGFFLTPGDADSTIIAAMADKAPTVTEEEESLGDINLSDLMGDLSTSTYYSYAGGLTTPGCLEIVTWIVIEEAKTITTASLEAFWNLRVHPGDSSSDKISLYGNYRPLQSKGSRTVYISSGTSAACGDVTEPDFDCPAPSPVAAASSPSPADDDTDTTDAGFNLVPSVLMPLVLLFSLAAFFH